MNPPEAGEKLRSSRHVAQVVVHVILLCIPRPRELLVLTAPDVGKVCPSLESSMAAFNKHLIPTSFVNFFSGYTLNRLSWLRPSHPFLNAIVTLPTTRWVVLDAGRPLIATHSRTNHKALAFLKTSDVKKVLGPEPFFGQSEQASEIAPVNVSVLAAARLRGPPIVFLGLQEPENSDADALLLSNFTDAQAAVTNVKGTAIFSVDVDGLPSHVVDETLHHSELATSGNTLIFEEARSAMNSLDHVTSGIFATAKSLINWHRYNKVGSRTFQWNWLLYIWDAVLPGLWLTNLLLMGRLETLVFIFATLG
jgi:hypothetical protein